MHGSLRELLVSFLGYRTKLPRWTSYQEVRQQRPGHCHSRPRRSSDRPPSLSRPRWCLRCRHRRSGGGAQVRRRSSGSRRRCKALLVRHSVNPLCTADRGFFAYSAEID